MTNEEAIYILQCIEQVGISLTKMPETVSDHSTMTSNAINMAIEALNNERPKSEWEIVDAEGGKIWNCVCTECGHDPQEYIGGTEDWWLRKPLPNYCPNCGADMRGDKE